MFHCVSFCVRDVYWEGQNGIGTYARMFRTYSDAQIVTLRSALFAKQKPLVMAPPRFSRITISRRCRHDTRYVHAFRRAKAIFRSNMIIKSNGIRNSSGARILSTNSFYLLPFPLFTSFYPPQCLPCRLLRSTHVFPGIRQGMHFTLFPSFLFSPLPFLSLSRRTDTGIHEWAE